MDCTTMHYGTRPITNGMWELNGCRILKKKVATIPRRSFDVPTILRAGVPSGRFQCIWCHCVGLWQGYKCRVRLGTIRGPGSQCLYRVHMDRGDVDTVVCEWRIGTRKVRHGRLERLCARSALSRTEHVCNVCIFPP